MSDVLGILIGIVTLVVIIRYIRCKTYKNKYPTDYEDFDNALILVEAQIYYDLMSNEYLWDRLKFLRKQPIAKRCFMGRIIFLHILLHSSNSD